MLIAMSMLAELDWTDLRYFLIIPLIILIIFWKKYRDKQV